MKKEQHAEPVTHTVVHNIRIIFGTSLRINPTVAYEINHKGRRITTMRPYNID